MKNVKNSPAVVIDPQQFHTAVLQWFDNHGRKNLPWQHPITPYRVWISEIMLQQTQVTTVINYFERFMQQLPTVQALAQASEDTVLHLWTGLGYYTRARNLHRAAKMIITEFNGELPANLDQLQQLPGIGRSTAAAILSIAFQQPAAILDGNVKRVLNRYLAFTTVNAQVEKQLWEIAELFAPIKRCGDYTQAMMDLGATICTRTKPQCNSCPLQQTCQGYASGAPTQFPAKKIKAALPVKHGKLIILQNKAGEILLEKRPGAGIWGGLWCLPAWDETMELSLWCKQVFGLTIKNPQTLPEFRHTFSHYHYQITPILVQATLTKHCVNESKPLLWYNTAKPANVGLAAPIKKLLHEVIHAMD
jgi:A/G-specific adenine glycosylase